MKKVSGFLLIMLLVNFNLKAQSKISAVAEINYNTFGHKDLKNLQQQLRNDVSEIDLRVNDDFGANTSFSVGLKLEDVDTQFFFSYNSTGGKISYSDYSGVFRVTQLLQAYTLGVEHQFRLSNETSKNDLFLGARSMVNFTTLEVESYSGIYDSQSTEVIDFNSADFGIGARLIYDIPVWLVKLRLNAGYDLIFGGELKFSDDQEYALEDNSGERVKTGWSGFRTGIGVVVPF